MRLGINGFFWDREATGSGQYTRQLVRALSNSPGDHQWFVFGLRSGKSHPEKLSNRAAAAQRLLRSPVPLTPNLAKVWFEQISFPRACRAESVDVVHVPYFAPPLTGGEKMVVTIHDLIPLILPAYRGSPSVRLYTRLVSAGASRSAAIITDSLASRDDILRLLRVDPARVHVIPLAAHERFKPVHDPHRVQRVRERYGLPDEYVLYLGGFDQRKNLSTLLAAYAAVSADLTHRTPLVIAGRLPSRDSEFFPHPRVMVRRRNLEGAVRFVGWVHEEDKPVLYSEASIFVFPSLYEGFGLPLLEAMCCGTPVIASEAASLPEISGEAAVLFAPHDVEGLAKAISELLQDVPRRELLGARGLERAQLFSWKETATQTLKVYESVAARD
jgi:glycosyltransferase involved in cell wall biosynthesis